MPLLSSLEGIWKPYPKNISIIYFAFSKAFRPLFLSKPFLIFLGDFLIKVFKISIVAVYRREARCFI